MSAFDFQPRHKFGDVEFPSSNTRVRLVFRHHVHEYPHSPGGSPEKLGRALVQITCRVSFQATFGGYPDLYPAGMNTMFGYASQGATLNFTHPSRGTFPMFITNWDQEWEAKCRSGEFVDIEFLEDQEASDAVAATTDTTFSQTMAISAGQLAADLAATQADLAPTSTDLDVFDALQSAVNAVTAFKDTSTLYQNLYSSKIDQVIRLCNQVDQLTCMQDVRAWPLVDDLRTLWSASVRVQNDLQSQQAQLKTYNVPYPQSLAQIALTLYGDASRISDLTSLNALDDVTNVPAGIQIQYYPPTPQARVAAAAA